MLQESIAISTLQEQAQNDKTLGNIRRKTCSSIKIRGATGMHASVINGIYEPSPTELCGGWPVYYNNCASKSDTIKHSNGKAASIAPAAGGGVGVEGGVGGGGTDATPDITKSFLLFCPYAMSWAITVLANFNDPNIPVVNPLTPTIASSIKPPATTATTTTATAAALTNVNDQKANKITESNDMILKIQSVFPDSLLPHQTTQILNTEKDSKSLNSTPYYTPSSAPLTLAFFEVSSNIQPELAHNTATWKVILFFMHEHFCVPAVHATNAYC